MTEKGSLNKYVIARSRGATANWDSSAWQKNVKEDEREGVQNSEATHASAWNRNLGCEEAAVET